MSYLKEIIKAKIDRKTLPGLFELINEHGRWSKFKNSRDVFEIALPWITYFAIDFLDQYVNRGMHVLEYGGGGSTFFFAPRVEELVTIEHDKRWFEELREKMKKNSGMKWVGCFIEPEKASTVNLDRSNPDHYVSDDENYQDKIFKKYASAIDQYPDEYFDLVLVDGRARPSCLNHSLPKVKRNGLLILDNADRDYYLEHFDDKLSNYELVCNNFGPTPYISSFTQTNIWRRMK